LTSVIPIIFGLLFLTWSFNSGILLVKQSAFVYKQLIKSNLCNERTGALELFCALEQTDALELSCALEQTGALEVSCALEQTL
jgi:hypothetical protein